MTYQIFKQTIMLKFFNQFIYVVIYFKKIAIVEGGSYFPKILVYTECDGVSLLKNLTKQDTANECIGNGDFFSYNTDDEFTIVIIMNRIIKQVVNFNKALYIYSRIFLDIPRYKKINSII